MKIWMKKIDWIAQKKLQIKQNRIKKHETI